MKTDIDETLRTWWAERRKHDDIESLCQKITQAVAEDRFEEPTLVVTRPATLWLPRLGYALAGAAALAIVMLGVQRFGGPETGGDSGFLAMARIPSQELAAGARVFNETAQLFEHRLKWIVESNGDVGMGVDSCPEGDVDDAPPAFVRVMVLERTAGEETWRRTWKADVIVRGQQMAEVATNGDGKHKLMLWVYPMEDGRLLVDTDMVLTGSLKFAARESSIMIGGEPAEIASMRRGDTEYRVLQTVEMLSETGAAG